MPTPLVRTLPTAVKCNLLQLRSLRFHQILARDAAFGPVGPSARFGWFILCLVDDTFFFMTKPADNELGRVHFAGYVRLVRTNANFRRLWSAQVVSEIGDWFTPRNLQPATSVDGRGKFRRPCARLCKCCRADVHWADVGSGETIACGGRES